MKQDDVDGKQNKQDDSNILHFESDEEYQAYLANSANNRQAQRHAQQ